MSNRGVIAGLVGCLLLVGGCASAPSQDDLKGAILVAAADAEPVIDLSDKEADCIAGELLESNLSDTTLAGLAADFESPRVLETELDDVGPLVTSAALQCADER